MEVFLVTSCAAGSLLDALAQLPDPRKRKGKRHSLAAMLAAVVCGILTGSRGYKAISQWLRNQEPKTCHWLGFTRKPPCANAFRNLLMRMSPEALEAVLIPWVEQALQQLPATSDSNPQPVALDGKSLCGTLTPHQRCVHLLALYDQRSGGVLSQRAVPGHTNEAKTALPILKSLVLQGRLITADAMFCQREICQQIVDDGGEYLIVVKKNQPELLAAIKAEFQVGFSPL